MLADQFHRTNTVVLKGLLLVQMANTVLLGKSPVRFAKRSTNERF